MIKKPVLILEMIKGIIFDFDGVIADSVHIKSDGFREIYRSYGSSIVKKVVNHHEANGGMDRFKKIRFYHKNFLNKVLSNQDVNNIADQFSKYVFAEVVNADYVPYVLDFIKQSYDNYKLFISTGTPQNEIKKILKLKKIAKYFKSVHGSPMSKTNHIKFICRHNNMKHDELIFFGDANSDLEAARENDIQFVLRLHKYNRKYFQNYSGKKIKTFRSLDILSLK